LFFSRQARDITYRRKASFYDYLIRQRENIQSQAKNFTIENDEEGNIADVGYPDYEFDYCSFINPPDFSKTNPEQCCIHAEIHQKLRQIPAILSNSSRTRAQEYLRIFILQMKGVDVASEHGPDLCIPEKKKVASYKFHLKKFLIVIFSELDPDLLDKIATSKAQKGKKWKTEKSTFEERKALFRDPYFEAPSKILYSKMINGQLTYLGEIDPFTRSLNNKADEKGS
jgi:hypothetical protein